MIGPSIECLDLWRDVSLDLDLNRIHLHKSFREYLCVYFWLVLPPSLVDGSIHFYSEYEDLWFEIDDI